jgi:hypothetical protein
MISFKDYCQQLDESRDEFLKDSHVQHVVYHGTNKDFHEFDPKKIGSNWKQDKHGFFFANDPHDAEISVKGGKKSIMPVYLSIKNPLVHKTGWMPSNEFDWNRESIIKKMIDGGHDGAIIHGHSGFKTYIVREPHQIKSAIGNNGDFDPTSKKITESTDDFLDGSVIRHTVYHKTGAKFDEFDTDRGQLGSHFGSIEQAHKVPVRQGKPTMVEAHLNIKNPLRLKDHGSFGAGFVRKQLVDMGLTHEGDTRHPKEIIQSHGYDGVVYANEREGKGDSWIALHPHQIKILNKTSITEELTEALLTVGEVKARAKERMVHCVKDDPSGLEGRVYDWGNGRFSASVYESATDKYVMGVRMLFNDPESALAEAKNMLEMKKSIKEETMTRKLTLSVVEQEKKVAQLTEETKDMPMFDAAQKFEEAGLFESPSNQYVFSHWSTTGNTRHFLKVGEKNGSPDVSLTREGMFSKPQPEHVFGTNDKAQLVNHLSDVADAYKRHCDNPLKIADHLNKVHGQHGSWMYYDHLQESFDQKIDSIHAMDRFYIATHGNDAHRDQLVKDEDAMVRFGVAKTGHLTHLAQLANDPSPMVRDQVARRGDEELVKKLAEDPHPMVRSSAYNRMQEIRRTIDDPAVISSANGVNESVESPKHFGAGDVIQVKSDGRFASVKTFFEDKDDSFWYAVSLPGGGSEVLHESEVRSLDDAEEALNEASTKLPNGKWSIHDEYIKEIEAMPAHAFVKTYEYGGGHAAKLDLGPKTYVSDASPIPTGGKTPEEAAENMKSWLVNDLKGKSEKPQYSPHWDNYDVGYRLLPHWRNKAAGKIEEAALQEDWRDVAGHPLMAAASAGLIAGSVAMAGGAIGLDMVQHARAVEHMQKVSPEDHAKYIEHQKAAHELLKKHLKEEKLEERHADTAFATHRDMSGEGDTRHDINKPVKLKKADGTIHSTHDNEHSAMQAYKNEPDNKGMKIVRESLCEDRENEFTANHALAGDNSVSKPNKPVKLKRADGTVHSEHDNEHSALQAYKNESNNKGMKIVREAVEEIDPETMLESLQEGFQNECPFCNPALMESADQQILSEEHEAALVYHDQQAQRTDLPTAERHFHVRCYNKHKRSI